MRITVVPSDNVITIDGETRHPVNPEWPEGLHAIQWDGESGKIEWHGRQDHIEDFAIVQPYIDMFAEGLTPMQKAKADFLASQPENLNDV